MNFIIKEMNKNFLDLRYQPLANNYLSKFKKNKLNIT